MLYCGKERTKFILDVPLYNMNSKVKKKAGFDGKKSK